MPAAKFGRLRASFLLLQYRNNLLFRKWPDSNPVWRKLIAVSLGLKRSNAVVASPDFLRIHGIPTVPVDLYRFRCIRARLPNNALFRWKFEKDGEAVQIDVQGSITLDESSLVKIAAKNGVGLGYVMEADVRDYIAAGRLVRVLEDWTL
jgi:DNA-binding transcriptional LysR family regulator